MKKLLLLILVFYSCVNRSFVEQSKEFDSLDKLASSYFMKPHKIIIDTSLHFTDTIIRVYHVDSSKRVIYIAKSEPFGYGASKHWNGYFRGDSLFKMVVAIFDDVGKDTRQSITTYYLKDSSISFGLMSNRNEIEQSRQLLDSLLKSYYIKTNN